MDKFLIGAKRKLNEEEPCTSTDLRGYKSKTRKYDQAYLNLGFTSIEISGEEKPQCVICLKVLAADSLKPNKLKRHLETLHKEYISKPREFFEEKLRSFKKQKTNFQKTLAVNEKVLLASYKVAYKVAKCKKPHTIAEQLILPATKDIVETLFGESYAKQLDNIPLSNDTICRRISDISADIQEQLESQLIGKLFAIQLDEATDSNNESHLICYIRFCKSNTICEELLFCKLIEGKTTGNELFRITNNAIIAANLQWKNCVGICTDGAQAMSGKYNGLQALVKKESSDIIWTHCMIHREALASKSLSPGLNIVLEVVIEVVNYIKTRPLKSRIFSALCTDMGAEHKSLLFYSSSRWLSRGKVVKRIYELKSEIAVFLKEEGHKRSAEFCDKLFLMKLSYLVDIFEKLNTLNLQLQGKNLNVFDLSEKIESFCKKMHLWKNKLKENCFDMFPTLCRSIQDFPLEENHKIVMLKTMEGHLENLSTNFRRYFFAEEDINLSNWNWVCNPFDSKPNGLSLEEEEQLIDVSSSTSLKMDFSTKSLTNFWIELSNDFSVIKAKAIRILLVFPTSYLCETGFSAVASLKSKYRNKLQLEKELRVAISNVEPNLQRLCATKQAHVSH
jgi:hypothetical protein